MVQSFPAKTTPLYVPAESQYPALINVDCVATYSGQYKLSRPMRLASQYADGLKGDL